MPQTTLAKQDSPNALVYDSIDYSTFQSVTLANNQTTATIAGVIPCALATKIYGLCIVMTTVNGTAPVAVNICSGFVAEGGIGPVDPGPAQGYPPTTAQMAVPGNILFASDQQLNGASAPVANTLYMIYVPAPYFDIIWPPNSAITLRVSSGASASGGVLYCSLIYKVYDIHPYQPNGGNPFVANATIL